jgi:hypothetical protein
MATTRYRSESIRVKVTVLVNAVVSNLSLYSGIVVMLYYDNNQVLAKYSRDVLTGYDNTNFVIIDNAAGRFDILIQPSVTIPSNADEIKMEVLVQKSDALWESSTWRRIVSDVTVLRLKDSKTKNVGLA